MTPETLMRKRRVPLRLVIFDCDGVLVDSETITSRVTARALARVGWRISAEDAKTRFLGMSLPNMKPIIEQHLGKPLPADWSADLTRDLALTLSLEAIAIPGAVEALKATSALGIPWRIASNSSHPEMAAKFACLGISPMVAGRVHSFTDVSRGKPAPDLFLAACHAEGLTPDDCIVIEDSLPGVRAAVSAGMDCLGFAAQEDGDGLRAAGAVPFHAMHDLPRFFALATGMPDDV